MNLANLGLSGLNVALNRLQTAGHNINNAATPGYNRQSVLASSAGASSTGAGWVGRGVQADTVMRSYDSFLYRQLVDAQSNGAALSAYGNEIVQVNNLFGDPAVGISPALQNFFQGIQAVASSPADPSAREELLGRAHSLVGQINETNAFLDAQRGNINAQISTLVTQVNSHLDRIQDINQQIVVARATGSGHAPNDLLDQRDQLLSDLSQLVGVKVLDPDGGFNITLENGQVLLGGNTVFPLHAVSSSSDPSRTVLAYTAPAGQGTEVLVQMRDEAVTGGQLGGLLRYRREALDAVQDDLGRMAVGLALSVNVQHQQGYDLNGEPGEPFFSLGSPKLIAAAGNPSSAAPTLAYADANALTGQNYQIDFDGTDYVVTRLPQGSVAYRGDAQGGVQFDGLSLEPAAGAQAGDSWLLQPTRSVAASLGVALSDPARFAAAATATGDADGSNALELAQLQTGKVLGNGAMNLNESYAQIVNKVGVLTQSNAAAASAQLALIQQNFSAQQAVSGVNLNEEYVNLERYQEQFRAASRLIDVSGTLFDTLLGLRS